MDTFIDLCRAYVTLTSQAAEVLKTHDLSVSQYNVLRIIRGHGGVLASGEIGGRMVWPSSDLTRLLDGLERRGLIERERGTEDRRVVFIHLTPLAAKLLRLLDAPMEKLHKTQFAGLSSRKMGDLRALLQHFASPTPPAESPGEAPRKGHRAPR